MAVTVADNPLVISGKEQDGPGETGFTTIIRTLESVPQSLLPDITILKVPVCVGIPEIIPVVVEKDKPWGRLEVATLNVVVVALAPVVVAVRVYENG